MTNFPTDSNGYLQNTGSTHLIQFEISSLVNDVVDKCSKYLKDKMISMYVRGSVSIGEAYLHSSDIDIVVVLQEKALSSDLMWAISTTDKLLSCYDVVSDIDLTIISLRELLNSPKYARLRVYLATRSALLKGQDVRDQLPRFKPNGDLAAYMYPNIEEELASLREIFIDESKTHSYLRRKRSNEFWCVWTMRTVLRSAQALTMVTEKVYECELKACLDNVTLIYPHLQRYMEKAYEWALNPTNDPDVIVSFLDEYLPVFLDIWHKEIN